MVLHAKKSAQLLRDLQRARWLPPFNEKVIKEVAEEINNDFREFMSLTRMLDSDLAEDLEVPQDTAGGLMLYTDLMERNKRNILIYLNERLEKIEELRWEIGHMIPEDKLGMLSEAEKVYLYRYNDILDNYMRHYVPECKAGLDLTADVEAPEEMNVQVRVLDDSVGEILTPDSGVVRLQKGCQLFLKRTDVEHLIRAGKVEHVRTIRAEDTGCAR